MWLSWTWDFDDDAGTHIVEIRSRYLGVLQQQAQAASWLSVRRWLTRNFVPNLENISLNSLPSKQISNWRWSLSTDVFATVIEIPPINEELGKIEELGEEHASSYQVSLGLETYGVQSFESWFIVDVVTVSFTIIHHSNIEPIEKLYEETYSLTSQVSKK